MKLGYAIYITLNAPIWILPAAASAPLKFGKSRWQEPRLALSLAGSVSSAGEAPGLCLLASLLRAPVLPLPAVRERLQLAAQASCPQCRHSAADPSPWPQLIPVSVTSSSRWPFSSCLTRVCGRARPLGPWRPEMLCLPWGAQQPAAPRGLRPWNLMFL